MLCDRLAADPSDPDKPADVKGVSQVAAGDIATAIKYCAVAGKKERRAMYQLGRAYASSGQMTEAMAAWRKAADKGSSSAMVESPARSREARRSASSSPSPASSRTFPAGRRLPCAASAHSRSGRSGRGACARC